MSNTHLQTEPDLNLIFVPTGSGKTLAACSYLLAQLQVGDGVPKRFRDAAPSGWQVSGNDSCVMFTTEVGPKEDAE